ncbi:hypothetical protein B1218_34350, partial [Pseudomonas ogarae]
MSGEGIAEHRGRRQATGGKQVEDPPGLGGGGMAAAGREAGCAMGGEIGQGHAVVAGKMSGKAQPG